MPSEFQEMLASAGRILAGAGARRAGPCIGTLDGHPIHDFIEANGKRWSFDGNNFRGRALADSDIVHRGAVYAIGP